MLKVHHDWPLVSRDGELDEARHALQDPQCSGLIITGAAGVGKTALAQQAARQLEQAFELVYIRGSAAAAAIPYGALSFVLSDLADAIIDNPLMVLRGLQQLYGPRADGRQTLILADNLEDLDPSSSMAISHLVRVGAVKLIAVCQRLDASSEDFCNLWKDGALRRIDLAPLGPEATAQLLSVALEAPISRSVAAGIWHSTGGNPLLLQALVREQVDNGEMLEYDGVWVAMPYAGVKPRRRATDPIVATLRGLPAEQRGILKLVSVVGAIPLELLLRLAPSESVDELQRHRILRVDHTVHHQDSPMVSVTSGLLGEVVRAQVDFGSGQELIRKFAEESKAWVLPPSARMNYASWCVDFGSDIDPDCLLEAARLANQRHDGALALRLVGTIPDSSSMAGAVLEEARALAINGDAAGALQLLENFLDVNPGLAFPSWMDISVFECLLLVRIPPRCGEAALLLEEIRQRLAVEGTDSEDAASNLSRAQRTVGTLAAELAAFDGRYAEIVQEHGELLGRLRHAQDNIDLLGWLAEALAMTGRQEDAVELARIIHARLVDTTADPFLQEAGIARVFTLMIISGSWEECLSILRTPPPDNGEAVVDAAASEFAEGCLLAYGGRATEALDKLLPSLSQLRVRDRHQLLPVAEATTAYAYAMVGELSASQLHLERAMVQPERLPWVARRAVEYFSALAAGATQPPLEVARRMLTLADEDCAAGNHGQEIIFLCQSVQLGLVSAADRLVSSALAVQGPLAEVAAQFGKGVGSRDVHQLLLAARSASDIGNHRLGAEAGHRAARLAQEDGDLVAVAEAEKVLRQVGAPGISGGRAALESLTDRERSIAVLVARGHSNREIAQLMYVSVRTVEGHVYRLYSKLGVSSRGQLALLME